MEQNFNIPITSRYNKKNKQVEIWVTPFAMVSLPFETLKKIYYEMRKYHEANNALILPEKEIITRED